METLPLTKPVLMKKLDFGDIPVVGSPENSFTVSTMPGTPTARSLPPDELATSVIRGLEDRIGGIEQMVHDLQSQFRAQLPAQREIIATQDKLATQQVEDAKIVVTLREALAELGDRISVELEASAEHVRMLERSVEENDEKLNVVQTSKLEGCLEVILERGNALQSRDFSEPEACNRQPKDFGSLWDITPYQVMGPDSAGGLGKTLPSAEVAQSAATRKGRRSCVGIETPPLEPIREEQEGDLSPTNNQYASVSATLESMQRKDPIRSCAFGDRQLSFDGDLGDEEMPMPHLRLSEVARRTDMSMLSNTQNAEASSQDPGMRRNWPWGGAGFS